jgi:hypothetical protein
MTALARNARGRERAAPAFFTALPTGLDTAEGFDVFNSPAKI